MILRKIKLNNIRSYESEEVEFEKNSTLLSGDIGSGKTSVLLAVEFALFGLQPGQKGSSILRNGKDEGGVILEFEVSDKRVIIERNLKRGKTITQNYCAVSINGEKKEITVTELKNEILDLLGYPKEFSKKQNILYKFTVYTPQEEMKQIILEDPETRINTLRHVFGIDKYKTILENLSILVSKIREDRRTKEGRISSLDEDRAFLVEKEILAEEKTQNLISLEKELFLSKEKKNKIMEEVEEVFNKIEEKQKLNQEIEKTNISIINKRDTINSNSKLIKRLTEDINQIKSLNFNESKVKVVEEEIIRLKKDLEITREEKINIISQLNSMKIKTTENDTVIEKLKRIEICPTCMQDVSSEYKNNVLTKMKKNSEEIAGKISVLLSQRGKLENLIEEKNLEIERRESELKDLSLLKMKFSTIPEKQDRINEIEKTNQTLNKDLLLLSEHIEILKSSLFELNKYSNIYEEKKKLFESASKEERIADIRVAEMKREIEVFGKQISELKERIMKSEKIREELNYLSDLEEWLSRKFAPIISVVEKNVMVKLKSEFSKLFAEWFSMLVSENFDVKMDEDFTPVISQQDYEIDYAYLSGGERTAVALAYRLALNRVINSLMSKIKTKDLVILDEPTDGFSDQQIDKMREVLEQLNVKQLIIVSHEQKIESLVENVIRFKKEHGISKRIRG